MRDCSSLSPRDVSCAWRIWKLHSSRRMRSRRYLTSSSPRNSGFGPTRNDVAISQNASASPRPSLRRRRRHVVRARRTNQRRGPNRVVLSPRRTTWALPMSSPRQPQARLPHLPLLGEGGRDVERFSSAVGRVADELGVSTRRLVNHYAPGVLPRSPRRLDTPGADGWRLLESFNALTGVNYTPGTLAAYSDFDLAGFMREFRAVCTLCLAS